MKKLMRALSILALLTTLGMAPAMAQQGSPQAGQPTEWVCPRTGQTVKAGQGMCCGQQMRNRGGRQGGKMMNCPYWGQQNQATGATSGSGATADQKSQ